MQAIVTGASRGVGRAVARALAGKGYKLILNCHSEFDKLDELAEELSAVTECVSVHGAIDKDVLERYVYGNETLALVNNAGISKIDLLQDTDDVQFSEMVENNLHTMYALSRDLIPYLLKSTEGRIVNISSVWGVCGASTEVLYSMTKGGVNAFTRALSKELAPSHIAVNALALGAVDTDMNRWLSEEDRESLCEEIPYGRMASPEEVAELVALMLQAPTYLTGQVIQFDGGWI